MKLGACYVLHDDLEFLHPSLSSVSLATDKVIFLVDSRPWNFPDALRDYLLLKKK